MGDIAIKIENLSKQYRLGVVGTGTLSHDMKRWWTVNVRRQEDPYLKIGETNDRASKGMSDYVWALKDINLEIKQGDVVGIIGKNGAGKSTLLKILSRVTKPTTGSIDYKGRIASLLEVGTGFHSDLTGRENIYMNGAIMGMSRAEITRKFDEIVAFAGVDRYIDTPVKRYSSGMTVRLGFSIAAHLEPDILVVDEVLAVGDAEFQKKAIGKMQDVSKEGGRTVLFVSHNMGAIANLCNTALLFEMGRLVKQGETHGIISDYLNVHAQSSELYHKQGDKSIYIKKIIVNNSENKISLNIFDTIDVNVIFDKNNSYNNFIEFFILISNENGDYVASYFQKDSGTLFSVDKVNNECNIRFENKLHPGNYFVSIGAFNENRLFLDWVENAFVFEVNTAFSNKDPYDHRLGNVFLQAEWSLT